MRVATIDIGTNTVLLLVAEQRHGGLGAVSERATITRLGQGVDRSGQLAPEAIARTTECLRQYAAVVRGLGVQAIAVVGTSAMRDARGGEAIRDAVQDAFGVEARVISGEEEARLTFLGALSGLTLDDPRCAVFDIGGGSTEVVLGQVVQDRPHVSWARSFDVGSVRLTERHGEDREAILRAASAVLGGVPALPSASAPIGIAGTMTTLAAVSLALQPYDPDRVHGMVMTTEKLSDVVHRLAAIPVDERRRVPGMEPKRADVIVAGGWIAVTLLEHWRAASVRISDRGVRWGLAQELANQRESDPSQ